MSRHIALFGGSFNPPHLGHSGLANYLVTQPGIDTVWILPCYQHAFGKPLAPFEQRLALCQLAFRHPKIAVQDLEREVNGGGYTVETLRFIHRKFPDDHFSLAVGADILREQAKWKDFQEIPKLANILYLPRRGFEPENSQLAVPPFLPEISSSEIRQRVRAGLDISGLVAPEVAAYIRQQQLYLLDTRVEQAGHMPMAQSGPASSPPG
jgi:nicotinate-nucleotide adenylyltransferase